MGDVFHAFPALTDAMKAIPDLQVDWVVEKAFAEIPSWHPVVQKVYPIELRRWRKQPWQYRQQVKAFFAEINQSQYDLVLDAQGLLKSAWVSRKMDAPVVGFDRASARESWASFFYQTKVNVAKKQHAIKRLRELFAKALHYPTPSDESLDYHLNTQAWLKLPELTDGYMVFLHGTTWETKLWPEAYWIALLKTVVAQGVQVVLPWGNEVEKQRANRIAKTVENHQAWVPKQKLDINTMARCLKFAKAVVSVDTGLSHVAAALEVPMVVIYRVTDPELVGAQGQRVIQLVSPLASEYIKQFENVTEERNSLQNLQPEMMFQALRKLVVL